LGLLIDLLRRCTKFVIHFSREIEKCIMIIEDHVFCVHGPTNTALFSDSEVFLLSIAVYDYTTSFVHRALIN